jgi:hypothetical protein
MPSPSAPGERWRSAGDVFVREFLRPMSGYSDITATEEPISADRRRKRRLRVRSVGKKPSAAPLTMRGANIPGPAVHSIVLIGAREDRPVLGQADTRRWVPDEEADKDCSRLSAGSSNRRISPSDSRGIRVVTDNVTVVASN